MMTPPPSYVPPNCHSDCETTINDHISLELYTANMYESLAFYFHSNEEGFEHLVQVFLQQAGTERARAQSLMQLQEQRRGRLQLQTIINPDPNRWQNSLTALEYALDLKTSVNQSLLDLQFLAIEKNDTALWDFLKNPYQPNEMRFIIELRNNIANLHKMRAIQSRLAENFSAKLTLEDSDKN